MNYNVLSSILVISLVAATGCNDFKTWYAREFKQGEVSSGIVRLSTQHLSMITSELGKKFKEPDVQIEVVPAKEQHEFGKGHVIKTLKNLEIKHPTEEIVYTDCQGNDASWHGGFEVLEATQVIYGRLTNNPENPVIPDANGVKMNIRVKPKSSMIRFSSKDAFMELDQGEISFDVYPRLAQMQKGPMQGLRLVPTSNNRFENIRMKNVNGTLVTNQVKMPFDISDSDYTIQVGRGENGEENRIEGEITIFGQKRHVPLDGTVLDENYNAESFVKSYSCNEGLNNVVEYENIRFEEKLGPGMAALTMLAMSKVAGQFSDDYLCGMSSPSYLRSTVFTGKEGEFGESNASLANPCIITFQNYRTEPDCFGVAYEIDGTATVTKGNKILRGLIFDSQENFEAAVNTYEKGLETDVVATLPKRPEPILPGTRQPAIVEITADLGKLTIKEVCVEKGSTDHAGHCSKKETREQGIVFKLHGGEVSATLMPVMGKNLDPNDERYKLCTVRNIPIAESELKLNNVTASIRKSGNEIELFASGAYRAVSGRIGDRENQLSGEIIIGNTVVPFRNTKENYLPLKSDYDPQQFEDSFCSCNDGKFMVPAQDDDCSLDEFLGN